MADANHPHAFDKGQLVTCILYDGIWMVHEITPVEIDEGFSYCRYEIRQGDAFKSDIPSVWLESWKGPPAMSLVA